MGIPYVRYLQDARDGCHEWECLTCHETFVARSCVWRRWESRAQWKFCPYCGVEWQGERVWDADKKLAHGHGPRPPATKRLAPLRFTIEQRFHGMLSSGQPTPWTPQCRHLRDAVVTAQALKELRAAKARDGQMEYRARPELEEVS